MPEKTELPADAHAPAPIGHNRPARPEGFQLPMAIWKTMFACYGVFFTGLAMASGGSGPARLVLAVSGLFILTYFTCGAILARLAGKDAAQATAGKPLQTIYGPMSAGAVWAQVLTVPIALAFFGMAIVLIAASAGL